MEDIIEHFVVRHYTEDEYPCIKGNGFDGTLVGEDREDAEDFIQFVNALIDKIKDIETDLKEARELYKEAKEKIDRYETAMNPRKWSSEMDKAWHKAIPDLYKAFEEIRTLVLK